MPDQQEKYALELTDIHKSFGGVRVLAGVSLQIPKGQTVLLVGSNGAGKTTLFNIMSGFLAPDSGTVRMSGTVIPSGLPHKVARLGMRRTFQDVRIFPTMSVLENVLMGGIGGREAVMSGIFRNKFFRQQEKQLEQRAREWLEFVGLESRVSEQAGLLSFGQQKLLEIARALTGDCEVLLLDEPVAGVHRDLAIGIMGVLRELHTAGKTMIIIEHERDLVAGLTDRAVELSGGRILKIEEACSG